MILGQKPILAILVLYRMRLSESPTYRSLQQAFARNPDLEQSIEMMVADNSAPVPEIPEEFHGCYVADGTNPGLARRYNYALSLAEKRGSPWLLLLDQDTTLSIDYLREIVRRTRELVQDLSIVALVPKLIQNDQVQSPHLRPKYSHQRFDRSATGRSDSTLYAFNSASVVRVSRLREVGGFPEKFWLDFLDHATFHLLQQDGGRVFVLDASLEHDLSANNAAKKDRGAERRFANMLHAELDFYQQYGTVEDRFYHRVRLFKGVLGALVKKRRVREALIVLRVAVRG